MRSALFRLTLLLAALIAAALCVLAGTTWLRLGSALVCGASWVALSWRKARSIDRDRMGLTPRR